MYFLSRLHTSFKLVRFDIFHRILIHLRQTHKAEIVHHYSPAISVHIVIITLDRETHLSITAIKENGEKICEENNTR